MKKSTLLSCFIALLASCNQQTNSTYQLQSQIDSLKQRLSKAYKPGLGEFMAGIQVHHAKLWFAGNAENWKLADFEIHEIMEAIDDIQQYEVERSESKEVAMLLPAIDSVNHAIEQKNVTEFKSSYIFLTNTCNNCHKAVNYDFNLIKIPDTPPYSNQVFKSEK